MLITLSYFFGGFFTLHGIYQLIKYVVIVKSIKKNTNYNKKSFNLTNSQHKIIILAPVLHEEKTLENFLGNISGQNFNKKDFKLYIITTEKEFVNSTSPNTVDILNSLIEKGKIDDLNIYHLHYPSTDGFKSDQLQFAYNYIKYTLTHEESENTFLLSLDTDSELNPNLLNILNNSIEKDVDIYQQPLMWFKNLDVIKSFVMQSFAFTQTFFSISYEIPMFTGKFFPWRLKYFVGHGLCLRVSFLNKIGGYPKIIEDVRLGRIATFMESKVKVLPIFGHVETAKNFSIYLKQSSVWFFGCGLFVDDYIYFRKKLENKSQRFIDVITITYGFFKAFRWLNKGLIHLLVIIIAIYVDNINLLIIIFISLLLNSSIPVLFIYKDFKSFLDIKLVKKKSVLFFILRTSLVSGIVYMFNFIGLYLGLIKIFKYYLWGKIKLPKTDR